MINHGVIYLTFLTHRSVSPVMRMKIVVTYCLDLTLSSELSKSLERDWLSAIQLEHKWNSVPVMLVTGQFDRTV